VKYNYSDALSHHREHKAFLEKITDLRRRIDEGESVSFTEVLDYLEQWFLHHVLVIDRRYVDLFLAEGVV
jgi:hemerythrin